MKRRKSRRGWEIEREFRGGQMQFWIGVLGSTQIFVLGTSYLEDLGFPGEVFHKVGV